MAFLQACANRIYDSYKVYAGFPPLSTIQPGDYGRLDGRLWTREGSLSSLSGLQTSLEVISSASAEDVTWETKGTSVSRFSAGANFGDGVTHVNAGFRVKFEEENACFYAVPGLRYRELKNAYQLGQELSARSRLDKHAPGFWNCYDEICVVTGVYATPTIAIALSQQSKSEVFIEAAGVAQTIGLEKATAELSFVAMSGASQKYTGHLGQVNESTYYTPFVVLTKVHWDIFGNRWWAKP